MTSVDICLSIATLQDKQDWDAYVGMHHEASAYHHYAWLEAVEHAYGHQALGVIARNKDSQQVVGLLPAVLMKTPLLGKQLCALPFCDVGYGVADSSDILAQMRAFLARQMDRTGSKKIEIRDIAALPDDNAELRNKKVRMLLSLPDNSEALMAGFKSKLRSQIRKAEKNGLTFTLSTSPQAISQFYHVYAQNMRDLGSPVHAKKWFDNIVKAYQDKCIISVVYKDSISVGAGLVIKSGINASIPWASTLRDFNKLAPNMLLYWSLLAHCADTGIQQFDFGRSTYEEGTYKFKKQWGAAPQLLNWVKKNNNNLIIEAADNHASPNKLRPILEDIWRTLPLGLTISIGSKIRPHINL